MKRRFAIIGGGIAGVAAARALAGRGHRVILLEREPVLGAHATGKNAAIFRQVCAAPVDVALAVRTGALLDRLFDGDRRRWLRQTGALYLSADAAPLDQLAQVAREHGVPVEPLPAPADVWPGLTPLRALHSPTDGVLDGHAILTALAAAAKAEGAEVRVGADACGVVRDRERIRGVLLTSHEMLEVTDLVIAGGAWARQLGLLAGATLPLRPLRRHLALLNAKVAADAPVLWRVDAEAYVRPESGGVLASPCDAEEWPPEDPPADPRGLERLHERLEGLVPSLAAAEVRRSWACLRTFMPDAAPVIGPDPRVPGLHWLAGLGGHGMSAGATAGELLATLVEGQSDPLAELVRPR